MSKSIIQKMEEAIRRPVPYEGLLGRQISPYGSRASESAEAKNAREQNDEIKPIELDLWYRSRT
jgi:hypothetical protein